MSRRGGLLAASLFAMACGGATPAAEEPITQPIVEQPEVGPEPEPEPVPQPEPGAEPEVGTDEPEPEPEDSDSFDRSRPEDPGVVALYGIAPR